MTRIWRAFRWLALAAVLGLLLLASPVLYVETFCKGSTGTAPYASILDAEDRRPETRTFLTYPEWHIVHAYEDYGEVISQGDPHDFAFLRSIGSFWSSLCRLNETAGAHGEIDWETKQMVYVIGLSFSVELVLKAAYEETLGRISVILRGQTRAPLDDISAKQAQAYAKFLRQVPWYKWQFREDADELTARATGQFRDREREFALGLEYRAKAAYAGVIENAVAAVGADALRLKMVVAGAKKAALATYPSIEVLAETPSGTIIETPRYRVLTGLLEDMAASGFDFVEIAGNDDILFSALSPVAEFEGAIHSAERQGFGDYRHLVVVKVSELADSLRRLGEQGARLEHIHDY